MKVKENDYFCLYCGAKLDYEPLPDGTGGFCSIECEDSYFETGGVIEDEVEPTEDEKRANAGCDECHRIMVEGRDME